LLPGKLWIAAQPQAETDCGCPGEATAAEAATGETAAAAPRPAWARLRLLIGAVTVLSLLASMTGYLALAVYASKLMLTTIIIGGVLLVARGTLRELLCLLLERRDGRVGEVGDIIAGGDKSRRLLGQAGRFVIDGSILIVAAFFLLPLTGMTLSEMQGLGDSFLRGVTVGGVRIAPGDILSAVIVLGVIVAVTRFLQRQLDERVLGELSIDEGVRNSIRTGVGYLGTTLAILVSVGTLGLDLSSLAMIAGALSVGIGFGLQNVVSNFISGLIMLVERPIKVGDWVVVNGMEGTVRRISVRATEIQTFQRASVIIPNSEFISKAVVNWTLKDKTTRIEIKVGVAHDSDVRTVYNLLLKIAREHHLVLLNPEPAVMFSNFGPSAFEFELRVFVSNTDFILPVRNELRMRIVEEFRTQGIRIPYDQRVVHMPKLEALLETMATNQKPTAPALDVTAGADNVVPITEKMGT
jgi:small-conductance mechanosensitive channel